MNETKKRLHENCVRLSGSDRTLRAMYGIIFDESKMRSLTMCETVRSVRTRSVSYGEVWERTERLAAAIRARLSCEDRYVGISGTNSVEWTVIFWAILRSGNRPYFVNLQQSEDYVTSVLRVLDVAAVIATEEKTAYPCENLLYTELYAEGEDLPRLPEDAFFGDAIAITTSGTTLRPKICIYTGDKLAAQVLNTESIVTESPAMLGDPKRGAKQLMFLPLYHIFGFSATYLWFCFFGAVFVFPGSLAPDALLHAARRTEVTHVFAVPLFWHAIEKAVNREISARDEKTQELFRSGIERSIALQRRFPRLGRRIIMGRLHEVRAKLLPDSVTFCISGGSHLRASAVTLLNALGYPLANGYGMSEIGITSVELSDRIDDRLRTSIGRPFDSVEYRISEDGHLLVRGSSLCSVLYLDGEPKTLEDWFDTGDIMTVTEDGRAYFEGRASDLIVGENGENVSPDRIEQAISIGGVVNQTVIADESGEKPILIVQIPKELPMEATERIDREIAEQNATLPLSWRVREVHYTRDALMRPTDIKVSRAYVRRELLAGRIRLLDSEEETVGVSDESETRARIRALFSEILGVPADSIAGNANFMTDLGGSSLDYFTLISELDRAFQVKLPYESEGFGYSLDDFERLIKEHLNL